MPEPTDPLEDPLLCAFVPHEEMDPAPGRHPDVEEETEDSNEESLQPSFV